MRYHVIDLDGKELKFRMTADEMEQIEEKYKVKLLDLIQDYSIKSVILLLKYSWKKEDGSRPSHQEAQELFDELADNGYALQTISTDIIAKTCVVSGLLTESALMEALNQQTAQK